MNEKVLVSGPTLRPLRDISAIMPRLDAEQVATALGAAAAPASVEEALAPLTLFAVRQQIVRGLQVGTDTPARSESNRRLTIPLCDEDWLLLEKLTGAVSSSGPAPSADQLASVLLSQALHLLASQASTSTTSKG